MFYNAIKYDNHIFEYLPTPGDAQNAKSHKNHKIK